MTASVPAAPAGPRRDPVKALRAIGAAILGTEAIVVALAIPVVLKTVSHAPAAGVAGLGAIAVLDVLVAGLLPRRERGAVVAGNVLQVGTLACGAAMSGILLFLGLVFAAMWVGWLIMRRGYRRALAAHLARLAQETPATDR